MALAVGVAPASAQNWNSIVCQGSPSGACDVEYPSTESDCSNTVPVPADPACAAWSAVADHLNADNGCDATWDCYDIGGGAHCIAKTQACVPDDFDLVQDCRGLCALAVNCHTTPFALHEGSGEGEPAAADGEDVPSQLRGRDAGGVRAGDGRLTIHPVNRPRAGSDAVLVDGKDFATVGRRVDAGNFDRAGPPEVCRGGVERPTPAASRRGEYPHRCPL